MAVSAESGGSGDDLRVELANSDTIYECQAKRGLSAGSRLDEAVDLFAKGMPARQEERGLILVDPTSARTITKTLRDDLEAWRQGANPELKGPLDRVIQRLRGHAAEDIARRMYVLSLDVEQDASSGAQNAMLLLERILDDPEQAGAAWGVLVSEGLRMCREGGRRDYDALVARLGQENIFLAASGQGVARKLGQVQVQIEAGFGRGEEQHQEILAALRLHVATPPNPPTSEADRFTIQLDTARQMIETGSAAAAVDLLRTISAEIASGELASRVRYHNLFGAALLHLGRTTEARQELAKVIELSPEDLTALANLAQAEALAGNGEAALAYADRLIEKDPLSEGAWIVVVQHRPEAAVPEQIADAPNVLSAKGFADTVAGRWDSAIENLRRASSHGFDAERALLLAQALYGRAYAQPDAARDTGALQEARQLLDDAYQALENGRDPIVLERVLVTRGQLERLRGNDEAADTDFAEAAARFPDSATSAYMLATTFLRSGDPARALYTAERISLEKRDAALYMMIARALVETGRVGEVSAALGEAVARRRTGTQAAADQTFAIVEIATEADLLDLADQLLEEAWLEPRWLVDLLQARLAVRRANDEAAVEKFEAATAGVASDADRELVAGEYAEYLRQHGHVRKALTVLESVDAGQRSELRPLYARLLFEAREITKSAALVQQAEAEGGELPGWALQLGAHVASLREDVPAAIRYFRELRDRYPANLDNAIRLVHALVWGQQREEALRVLDELRDNPAAAPRQLLQIAGAYIRAGNPEHALPLGYRALRLEPYAEDVQVAYVQLFTAREDDQEDLEAEIVAPDTAVTLRTRQGDDLAFFIATDEPRRAENEIAPDDELARELLGKRVGDEIVLRPGALSETVAEVVAIRSRYVYAFQDIFLHFPERHPQSTAIQSFKIPDDPSSEDFEFLTRSLQAGEASSNRLLEQYRAVALPLGSLAFRSGGTVVDAYALLANDPTGPFLVEFSDAISESIDAAGSDRPVVLTRSGLLTAEHLGLLDTLHELHPRLVAPWSLMEELGDERFKLEEKSRRGYAGMRHQAGQIIHQSGSAEYFQEQLAQCDRTVAWMHAHCELLPRPLSSVEAGDAQEARLREVIGPSSYDAIALAVDIAGELYADDLGLRRLFMGQTGRFGFSTYGLVRAAESEQRLTSESAELAVAELLRLRHAPVPMTARTFAMAFRDAEHQLDDRMAPLLDRLRDPTVSSGSAIMFCVDTLIAVASGLGGVPHVGAVSFALFEAAFAGRDVPRMLPVVEQVLRRRMQLLPTALQAAVDGLNRYVRIHVMGEPPLHLY